YVNYENFINFYLIFQQNKISFSILIIGSSIFGQTPSPTVTNSVNFFKPDYQQNETYDTKGGSDIDRLINMLIRNGIQRATPNPDISPNLLQAIFGK
ncbi:unnamed protein product, partial [Onchocerca flexuosa]|uniref:Secreted protein n=1 Tax=Onchocerca flexuosa TaxID=387005 RepID=A0A183I620_9BILA